MKFILKIIFIFCLFISTLANADDFSAKYPHLHQYLVVETSAIVAGEILKNSLNIQAYGKNAPQDTFFFSKSIECLRKFDSSNWLKLQESAVNHALSIKELQLLENYYASQLGQTELSMNKDIVQAMFDGKIDTEAKASQRISTPSYQKISKQGHLYQQKNHLVFDKFYKAIQEPNITQALFNPIASCNTL